MRHVTAKSSDFDDRADAAIRAFKLNPRSKKSGASIRHRGDGADVWEVYRRDKYGTHIEGSVSVSYRSGNPSGGGSLAAVAVGAALIGAAVFLLGGKKTETPFVGLGSRADLDSLGR